MMSGLGLELAGGGSDEAKAACITSSRSDSSLGSILPRPTKREQSELPSIDQLEKVEDVYGHRNRQPPLHSSALCTLHSALCTLHLDCLRRPLPDHSLQVARPGWRRPRVARGCSPDHLSLSPCHDKSDKHAFMSTQATPRRPPSAHASQTSGNRDCAPTAGAVACCMHNNDNPRLAWRFSKRILTGQVTAEGRKAM